MRKLLKPATNADIKRLESKMATKKDLEQEISKVRQKMATKSELANVKTELSSQLLVLHDDVDNLGLTVNKISVTTEQIYQMLDNEARFIKVMEVEHPLMVKRLERVEDKLGLPHTLLESPTK